jgi:cytochrome c oxidase assembly protein subunit 15
VIWLHRYARLLVAATLLLVAAGGMVTSTNSGLSVPDWPTSYGYSMFTFPLSKMVGGIFYEHGHRLIASGVGLLTIGLVIFVWRVDPRAWMKRLGLVGLAAVIAQGVLGGLTVRFMLPAPISIGHAGLAQLFFCLTVSVALFTSRSWISPAAPPVDDPRLRSRALALSVLIYAQILIGATMRHLGAGLAIPDFPLAFGHVLPPTWSAQIAVHFAHRVVALVVIICIVANAAWIRRWHADRTELARPSTWLVLAVFVQGTLGALVVLTAKQPAVNTLHVATGAVVLATSLVVTLRAFRVRFVVPVRPS